MELPGARPRALRRSRLSPVTSYPPSTVSLYSPVPLIELNVLVCQSKRFHWESAGHDPFVTLPFELPWDRDPHKIRSAEKLDVLGVGVARERVGATTRAKSACCFQQLGVFWRLR